MWNKKLDYRYEITSEILSLYLLLFFIPMWRFILCLLGEVKYVSLYRYGHASVKRAAK